MNEKQNEIHTKTKKSKAGKQDNIKSYLDSLANQDFYTSSLQFTRTYTLHKNVDANLESFGEISDWNNHKQLQSVVSSTSLPKLIKKSKNNQQLNNSEEQLGRYKSQLLQSVKGKKFNVNPINPKTFQFNSHIYSKSPRKSQLFFHKVLRLDDRKKLQQTIKINRANQGAWPRDFKQGPQKSKVNNNSSSNNNNSKDVAQPKKEPGILRMLRQRQLRAGAKKKDNSEMLKGIKFAY